MEVKKGIEQKAYGYSSFSHSFACDPNRVDELLTELTSKLTELKISTVNKNYLANFKEKPHKNRETTQLLTKSFD